MLAFIAAVSSALLAQATDAIQVKRPADLPPQCAAAWPDLDAALAARSQALKAKDEHLITRELAVWDVRVNQARFVCKEAGRTLSEAELDDAESDLFVQLDGQAILQGAQRSDEQVRQAINKCRGGAVGVESMTAVLDGYLAKKELAAAVGVAMGQRETAGKLNTYCGALLVERLKKVTDHADAAEAKARALPVCHQAATQWMQIAPKALQAVRVSRQKYNEVLQIPQVQQVKAAMDTHCKDWPDTKAEAAKAWAPVQQALQSAP